MYTGFTDGTVHDDIAGTNVHANSEGSAPLYQVTHGQAAIVGDDPFNLTVTKVKAYSPDGCAVPFPIASICVSVNIRASSIALNCPHITLAWMGQHEQRVWSV
jgi:hypothetical protein